MTQENSHEEVYKDYLISSFPESLRIRLRRVTEKKGDIRKLVIQTLTEKVEKLETEQDEPQARAS